MARNRYYEDEKQTYKFNKSSLKKAIKYAIPYKKTLIVVGVLMVIFSFVSLLPTLINTYIIDYVLSKTGIYGIDYLTLAVILVAGYALAVISTAVFNYFKSAKSVCLEVDRICLNRRFLYEFKRCAFLCVYLIHV